MRVSTKRFWFAVILFISYAGSTVSLAQIKVDDPVAVWMAQMRKVHKNVGNRTLGPDQAEIDYASLCEIADRFLEALNTEENRWLSFAELRREYDREEGFPDFPLCEWYAKYLDRLAQMGPDQATRLARCKIAVDFARTAFADKTRREGVAKIWNRIERNPDKFAGETGFINASMSPESVRRMLLSETQLEKELPRPKKMARFSFLGVSFSLINIIVGAWPNREAWIVHNRLNFAEGARAARLIDGKPYVSLSALKSLTVEVAVQGGEALVNNGFHVVRYRIGGGGSDSAIVVEGEVFISAESLQRRQIYKTIINHLERSVFVTVVMDPKHEPSSAPLIVPLVQEEPSKPSKPKP